MADGRADLSCFIIVYVNCISFLSLPIALLPCASGNNTPYKYGSDADSNAYFPHDYIQYLNVEGHTHTRKQNATCMW